MQFDGETGKPLRQANEHSESAGPTVMPSLSPGSTTGESSDDAEGALDDFPIDFNARR
jgi:hypothetical protein